MRIERVLDAPVAPIRAADAATTAPEARVDRLQRWRRLTQGTFFALFLLAPAFDLLRFDLHEAQLWVLGMRWSLGIDAFRAGHATALQTSISILLRGFVPAIALAVGFLAVAYRYGRIYCGWLCPHFSSVEMLNSLLHRAIGKLSLWDAEPTVRPGIAPSKRWWPVFVLSCMLIAFSWSVTLLTYLLPPHEIWGGLVSGTLTPNQARFIAIATTVFTLEFVFARHLFCRFGCAVGLFQSLAWMANPKGLVVAYARERASDCRSCDLAATCGSRRTPASPQRASAAATPAAPRTALAPRSALAVRAPAIPGSACESVCPMRLRPRTEKRKMFSCVQCGQCLQACDHSQGAQSREPLLEWRVGADALRESLRQRRAAAGAESGGGSR